MIFGKKKSDTKGEVAAPKKALVSDRVLAEPQSQSVARGGSVYRIIKAPYLTEKSSIMGEQNKYVFKVAQTAHKLAIKKAVESLYNVHVEKVRVISIPAKQRRIGKHLGTKSGFKKAIVSIRSGEKINVVSS